MSYLAFESVSMVSVVVCAIERGEAERVDTSCRDMIDFPLVCCEYEVWDEVTAPIVLSLFFDRTAPVVVCTIGFE